MSSIRRDQDQIALPSKMTSGRLRNLFGSREVNVAIDEVAACSFKTTACSRLGGNRCGGEFVDELNGEYDDGEAFTDEGNGIWDDGEEFEDEGDGIFESGYCDQVYECSNNDIDEEEALIEPPDEIVVHTSTLV